MCQHANVRKNHLYSYRRVNMDTFAIKICMTRAKTCVQYGTCETRDTCTIVIVQNDTFQNLTGVEAILYFMEPEKWTRVQ